MLSTIEEKIGYQLPKSYKRFLLKGQAEKYNQKSFPIVHDDGYKMTGAIYTFYTAESFLENNKYRDYLVDFAHDFELNKNYVEPKYLYHIVECLSGSICMAMNGIHTGKIYKTDNGDFGIIFISNTLEEFLKSTFNEDEIKCQHTELMAAVKENDFKQFKELIEEKDGAKLISLNSWLDIDIFDFAYKNERTEILQYYIRQGFTGHNRLKYYNIKIK